MEAEEWKLVQRAQAGDQDAFGALVELHQTFVYNLALHTLNDEREAEDAAQEALVRAWLALPNFRGQAQFRTWLYRIVTNLCCNRLPRLRRDLLALGDAELSSTPDDSPFGENPASLHEAAERRALVHRHIATLPESYRLLLTLRYQQELSYDEIAAVVSLPLGTVKTGLHRAKALLSKALQDYERGS